VAQLLELDRLEVLNTGLVTLNQVKHKRGNEMTLYQIQLRGHLDTRWEVMFAGFSFEHQATLEGQPITLMTGQIIDQSALYGVIGRLRNLGVELISVQPHPGDGAQDSDIKEQ
jgi:hypothetical protein